eukprot:766957-Hanusia_phi.AAC.8
MEKKKKKLRGGYIPVEIRAEQRGNDCRCSLAHPPPRHRNFMAEEKDDWEWQLLNVAGGDLDRFVQDRGEQEWEGEDESESYRVRQRSRMYRIQELKQRMQETGIRDYVEDLTEDEINEHAVTIASVR